MNDIIDLFTKQLMRGGELMTAQKIVRQVFSSLKKDHVNPWVVLEKAVSAVRPYVYVRTVRVGKSTISIPTALLSKRRQTTMAIRWIIQEARARKDRRTIVDKLLAELYDAGLHHKGGALKRRVRLHQLAEKNLGNLR